MNPKELRIGNYVNSENGIGKIECIEKTRVCVDNDKLTYTPISVIKPILLTEDWLVKFDFTLVEEYRCFDISLGDNLYLSILNCIEFQIGAGLEWISIKDKIKYVHQLQNLYFALTGKELKLSNDAKT